MSHYVVKLQFPVGSVFTRKKKCIRISHLTVNLITIYAYNDFCNFFFFLWISQELYLVPKYLKPVPYISKYISYIQNREGQEDQGQGISSLLGKERNSTEPEGWGRWPPGQCLCQKQINRKSRISTSTEDEVRCSIGTQFCYSPFMKILIHLTLKVVRLAVHEDVVDKYDAKDAGPQVQVTE